MYADRSIPAYAGEPSAPDRGETAPEVYPRVCGGTRQRTIRKRWRIGLSPRMRGNRRNCCPPPRGMRSIPAYAGEPQPARYIRPEWRVYPRVCGGTGLLTRRSTCAGGLSPRMRGNRGRCLTRPAGQRSIPAYAGEPTSVAPSGIVSTVYPRVCGGTADMYPQPCRGRGLSPRMRGNPWL